MDVICCGVISKTLRLVELFVLERKEHLSAREMVEVQIFCYILSIIKGSKPLEMYADDSRFCVNNNYIVSILYVMYHVLF